MPIITKNQQLPIQPVIILLIGDPGTSKTSLSNTCNNVLNIDFDLGFKRSYGRPDSLQLTNGWSEVIENLNNGEMDKYDTIVIDTAKGCLDDFLMVYVGEQDYKLKTNKLKAYGAIGDEFKSFINIIRRKGKDIFIIAHSKTEGDGDTKKIVADITGQSNALLLRIADQVGFLSMRNNQRVVTFNPSDTSVGKNVAGLTDIVLPMHTSPSWTAFADREIIQKVKQSLSVMSEEQREALNYIADWRNTINAVIPHDEDHALTNKELNETMQGIAAIEGEHLKKQIRAYFTDHLKKIGWKWIAADKAFKPIAPVAEPAPQSPVKVDESNPAALTAVKDDLFAPTV
ncbi:MAG: hypothetical protein JWQ09_5828 [Segetibacter sp.]|nr:hypothetical protein [Segetibacter sp.]